jgi:hypothetical protein
MTSYHSYEAFRKSEFSKLAFDNPFEIARPLATPLISMPLTRSASQNTALLGALCGNQAPKSFARSQTASHNAAKTTSRECRTWTYAKIAIRIIRVEVELSMGLCVSTRMIGRCMDQMKGSYSAACVILGGLGLGRRRPKNLSTNDLSGAPCNQKSQGHDHKHSIYQYPE